VRAAGSGRFAVRAPPKRASGELCFLRGSQALQMVRTLMWINNVNRFMATLEPIPYEWEQDPILFVVAVEESERIGGTMSTATIQYFADPFVAPAWRAQWVERMDT